MNAELPPLGLAVAAEIENLKEIFANKGLTAEDVISPWDCAHCDHTAADLFELARHWTTAHPQIEVCNGIPLGRLQ